jgi:hypothetical protein
MSKTFNSHSEYCSAQHHHTLHQVRRKNKVNSIKRKESHIFRNDEFDESAFFAEIAPLSNFKDSYTEKERRLLWFWLRDAEHYFPNEKFTKDILMRFIMKLNGMEKLNYYTRIEVSKYCSLCPSFLEKFLSLSKKIIPELNVSELIKLLSFVAFSWFHPDKAWLDTWFEKFEYFLTESFPEEEIGYCIDAIVNLYRNQGVPINNSWLYKWFMVSEPYLLTMSNESLCFVLIMVGMLNVIPPQRWMTTCLKRSHTLLEKLRDKELLLFAYAFKLEGLRNNKQLVENWFESSIQEIDKITESSLLTMCLLRLVYNNLPISHEWLNAWMQKVLSDFDHDHIGSNPYTRVTNLAEGLYALALLQTPLSFCLPFLEKCNDFFKDHHKSLFQEHNKVSDFRKIIFARNYFELLGFTLSIAPKDYPAFVTKFENLPKIESKSQHEFAKNLKILFGNAVGEEVMIPVIFDHVDFFIQEKNLVIEVDGNFHFIDGKENALTQVKTFMLKNAGYTVKRFTIDPKEKNLLSLLKTELAEFLPLPDKHNLSRNPKQPETGHRGY